jgi:prepilin-type N-terminal cleavage/methylation domain-containing protein
MYQQHGRRFGGRLSSQAGFTLLEVLTVVGILGTLAAMALMVTPAFSRHARAEGGVAQVLDVMRSARDTAISQRRNVEVLFIGLNAIRTRRIDIDAAGNQTGTTILRTVELENNVQFRLQPGVPNTPDAFGAMAGPLTFTLAGPWMFTSEGSFVGGTGDVANGSVFVSIANQPTSARAITVLGATGLVRQWTWNGRDWVE